MTVFATITDLVSGKIYALRRKGPAGSNVKFFLGASKNFLDVQNMFGRPIFFGRPKHFVDVQQKLFDVPKNYLDVKQIFGRPQKYFPSLQFFVYLHLFVELFYFL